MRRRLLVITLLAIMIIIFASYFEELNPVIKNHKHVENSSNILSMNFETELGSGIYQEISDDNWSTDGYLFNKKLSKCINNSELAWDNINNRVLISSIQSDKCYIYFDKEGPLLINKITDLYNGGSNGLYYHTSSLANSANDNSYRYSGANPNNWVCFGTDAETCDDEHLYRIIGVFNSKKIESGTTEQRVKLIKAYEGTETSLGMVQNGTADRVTAYYKGKLTSSPGYYWSGSKSNTSNLWPSSLLNTDTLNKTYLEKVGEWANKIAISEWKVGGNTYDNLSRSIPSSVYQNEIINPVPGTYGNNITTHNAKVGLMYASDYGFAFSSQYWTNKLYTGYSYNSSHDYNWLYLGVIEWIISRNSTSDYSNRVFRIHSYGTIDDYTVNGYLGVVRPTFYLNSNVKSVSGSGTSTDPYRIA